MKTHDELDEERAAHRIEGAARALVEAWREDGADSAYGIQETRSRVAQLAALLATAVASCPVCAGRGFTQVGQVGRDLAGWPMPRPIFEPCDCTRRPT